MNAEQNPLLRYDSLVQEYTERVEPLLTKLRVRVDEELARLRNQEATLLADRSQALEELQTAIGVDARFLLKTVRFQEFFEQYLNVKSIYNRDTTPEVDNTVLNWSLANFDRPLRVFAYQETFEPDDYDDEKTYASYSFNVTVGWDEKIENITDIQALKIYGFNNYRPESFAELAELISWRIEDFPNNFIPRNTLIVEEFSYLITYCCLLLSQQPSTIEFTYNLEPEGKHNLWQLPI